MVDTFNEIFLALLSDVIVKRNRFVKSKSLPERMDLEVIHNSNEIDRL